MMTDDNISRLFPLPGGERPIRNLYLDEQLRDQGDSDRPFVYANFVSSMDGRIGIPQAGSSSHQVPPAIANSRDWRLYQELAAQADVLITSARYFRQLETNEAQAMLPVGNGEEYADLRQWRLEKGLAPQPDIAIVTSTGILPPASLDHYRDRRIFVFAGQEVETARMQSLEREGVKVTVGATAWISGDALVDGLGDAGFRFCYAIGGPEVMHTLVAAGVLDRLYLTLVHCLLSGPRFDTILRGEPLEPAPLLKLRHLYHDTRMPAGGGQWLSAFDIKPVAG